MDKATFMKMLQETRGQWEELLAQIDEERMLQPGATGKWSVKDVIAHVMWGERELAPVMRAHVVAGSELWDLSDDERNEIWYQQNRERPLQEIMSEEQQNLQQAGRPLALDREERRLERLRLVSQLPAPTDVSADDEDDDSGPQAA